MKKKQVELLAPAGSLESGIAAINAGCDAVYTGGNKFSARAYAEHPDEEQLKTLIDYAHLHGAAVYLAVNTLLKEQELNQEFYDYLYPLYIHGVDAVIVQDLGALQYVKANFPELAVHISTQMTITGSPGVAFMKEVGADRIVLARELELPEIEYICKNTDTEIECFVHGALCYCYSGQCLYSSLAGGRSGNRGRCAQPCRLPYRFQNQDSYLLSPKDICTLEILPDIIEAGVYSLKIEGRMKRPEYAAGVTAMYRKYIDMYTRHGRKGYQVVREDMLLLQDLYNRGGFSEGYYHMHNDAGMMALDRPNHQGVLAGRVESVRQQSIDICADVPVSGGDVLEITSAKKKKTYEFTVPKEIKEQKRFSLKVPDGKWFFGNEEIYRTYNKTLLDRLKRDYLDKKLQEKIKGKLRILIGESVTLDLYTGEHHISVAGEAVQAAKNQPLTEARIREIMNKTGTSSFVFEQLDIFMQGAGFIPVQQLNSLRRTAMEQLTEKMTSAYRRISVERSNRIDKERCFANDSLTLTVSTEQEQLISVLCEFAEINRIYIDIAEYNGTEDEDSLFKGIAYIQEKGKKCYLQLPHIMRQSSFQKIDKVYSRLAERVDGFVCRNYESWQWLQEHGFSGDIIPDPNLYTFNSTAVNMWLEKGAEYVSAPLELNTKELADVGCERAELTVYGYIPVMISAGCIKKTTSGCDSGGEKLLIEDRKRRKCRVKTVCSHCYNIIYNSMPLHLLDQGEKIRRLGPLSLRLSFTTESENEVRQIVQAYIDTFYYKKTAGYKIPDFTRGHFLRGVE